MKFPKIVELIGKLPATTNANGKALYEFIIENSIKDILEIGFFHGKSTMFMAAALDEIGGGAIDTIDLESAISYQPNIHELCEMTGLSRYVNPVFSPIGSQWELRRLIIENTDSANVCTPKYDFVFVDAFHSWEKAGLDFLLSDKLLKNGGWVAFDDLAWSFDTSPSWKNLPETSHMPGQYRSARQIEDVFNYLVRQHPHYELFSITENWGWARKKATANELCP